MTGVSSVLRIVDLTTGVAGPTAAMILADRAADADGVVLPPDPA